VLSCNASEEAGLGLGRAKMENGGREKKKPDGLDSDSS
jgi:hypothetical protein